MNSKLKWQQVLQKNSTNQMRTATQKGRHSTHKRKIRAVLKEKMGKQSNAWPVY
jgi:hypothetical protein